jgi:hypothetical protein
MENKKNSLFDAKKTCSICKKNYIGYGNNALPVNSGRCCDDCNLQVVIPQRLFRVYGK